MLVPHFLDPCPPPGQTAKTALLISRRAGVDLSVQIIAVQDGKGLGRLLSKDKMSIHHPDRDEDENNENESLFFHTFTLEVKILISYLSFENKG
jgi:hypothetical protein